MKKMNFSNSSEDKNTEFFEEMKEEVFQLPKKIHQQSLKADKEI